MLPGATSREQWEGIEGGGEGFVRQSPEVLPKSDAPGPAVRPNSCCQETDGGEAWVSEELAQATFIAYLSPGKF